VDYGKELGIEFDLQDIEQPVVDLTPSPAVSSFIFYEGDALIKWVHRGTLIHGLAHIRDIETGFDGNIYLLLEHEAAGQIICLVPAEKIETARKQ